MLQKKVKKRASLLVVLFSASVIAIFFILQSLNNNILYFKSPTEIKNNQDIALYFTRSAIKLSENFKHIGVYGFTVKALNKFVSLPLSKLEKDEGLEQLRALDNGMKIKITIVDDPNISINTKSLNDLNKISKELSLNHHQQLIQVNLD